MHTFVDYQILLGFAIRKKCVSICYEAIYKDVFYYISYALYTKPRARSNFKVWGGKTLPNNLVAFKLAYPVYIPSHGQCL